MRRLYTEYSIKLRDGIPEKRDNNAVEPTCSNK